MKHFNLETQQWEGEEETKVVNSLEFLQSIYRDEQQPLPMRVRCAVEALPFESPKLTAQTNYHFDGSFAQLLDRAIERSQRPLLIEVQAEPVQTNTEPSQVSTEVMRKPFVQMRRRI